MTSTSPTAAMTLDQVADELGTNRLSVLRLIARGNLAAAMVADSYRVTPSSLENYVGNGALDFVTLDDQRGWFDRDHRRPDITLRNLYAKAAESQRPSNQRLRTARGGTINRPSMEVSVVSSRDITAASETLPVQASPWEANFRRRGSQLAEQLPLLNLVIAEQLHNAAKAALRELRSDDKRNVNKTEFFRFYDSPEAYTRAVNLAKEKVSTAVMRWHETLPIEVDTDEKPMPAVLVNYSLTYADAAGGSGNLRNRINRMVQLAF